MSATFSTVEVLKMTGLSRYVLKDLMKTKRGKFSSRVFMPENPGSPGISSRFSTSDVQLLKRYAAAVREHKAVMIEMRKTIR